MEFREPGEYASGNPISENPDASAFKLSADPGCECGHPFEGNHRTPGTECSALDCGCGHFKTRDGA